MVSYSTMIRKLIFTFCVLSPLIVLGQKTNNTIEFTTFGGLAVFNQRPSTGVSLGNSFIFRDMSKKHFFETSIRYTFANELQAEPSKPIFSQGYTDYAPMFNSVVSTADFSQNIGVFLLKKEKVFMSLSVGLGVRKWSEAKNGDIVITEMVWEPYIKIRDALTVYSRIWQLGGNVCGKVEFLSARKISFGYKTQYLIYNKNNCLYNELYFILKIPKLK